MKKETIDNWKLINEKYLETSLNEEIQDALLNIQKEGGSTTLFPDSKPISLQRAAWKQNYKIWLVFLGIWALVFISGGIYKEFFIPNIQDENQNLVEFKSTRDEIGANLPLNNKSKAELTNFLKSQYGKKLELISFTEVKRNREYVSHASDDMYTRIEFIANVNVKQNVDIQKRISLTKNINLDRTTKNYKKGENINLTGFINIQDDQSVSYLIADISDWQVHSTKNTTGNSSPPSLLSAFYIINVTAVERKSRAEQEVQKLKAKGYKAGFLWIPDYKSLSGAKLYSVYIGPFFTQKDCEIAAENYRKKQPNAYGVLVSQENKRVEIRGIGNVKVIK